MTPGLPVRSWNQLFSGPGPVTPVRGSIVYRRGRPFLLLPSARGPAAAVLDLYPAQSARARLAKTVLKVLLAAPVAWGREPVSLNVAGEAGFVQFLRSLTSVSPSELPEFGILAGNPAKDDQRFILLLFDRARRPVAVVKAGLTPSAQALLRHEESFLASFDSPAPAVPRLLRGFDGTDVRAIALDYIPGRPPSGTWDDPQLAKVLTGWVDGAARTTVGETAVWNRLRKVVSDGTSRLNKMAALASHPIPALIQHGDFAPRNIKVSADGTWTALDWERGERQGIPGWDWFHYALQPAILVKKRPANALIGMLEELLKQPTFQAYCVLTNIRGHERDLLLGYLANMIQVIQPSEGLPAMQQLWKALQQRWPG